MASSAHLQSGGTNEKEINTGTKKHSTLMHLMKKAREGEITWTWGGAPRTNVTALAMSSAFKHWKVEKKKGLLRKINFVFLALWNASCDSYFHTLIHCSCFLWIAVVMPEGKLSLHYSRRYTLQGRQMQEEFSATPGDESVTVEQGWLQFMSCFFKTWDDVLHPVATISI